MRLIAVHVGRNKDHAEPRLREVLVGHHLSLIADRFPGMTWLLETYPFLQDWPVTPNRQ